MLLARAGIEELREPEEAVESRNESVEAGWFSEFEEEKA